MGDLLSWIGDHAWVGWIGLGVVLTLIELLSLDLVFLMFGFGGFAGAAASALGAPFGAAVAVFGIVSVFMLFVARPTMARRLHQGPDLKTGPQRLIGEPAVALTVVNGYGGRVTVRGETWSARTEDHDASFEPSTELTVTEIDGATAVVNRKAS